MSGLGGIAAWKAAREPGSQSVDDVGQTPRTPSLLELFVTFFHLGCITVGGMWGAVSTLDATLVRKKGWLTKEDLDLLMVAATVVPSPRFLGFAGVVGFRLRKWLGSATAIVAILLPGALLVLLGAILLDPRAAGGPLASIGEAMQCAVVGLIFGNAFHQLASSKAKGRDRIVGPLITAAVAGAAMAGVSLIIAALVGIAVGAFVLRNESAKADGGK
ncbi:MAG TPA: chromate transporter [Stellaceae bacterium]|nr:chromate transporter [Stellaceae bacterium]